MKRGPLRVAHHVGVHAADSRSETLFAEGAADDIRVDERQSAVCERERIDGAAVLILVVVEVVDAGEVAVGGEIAVALDQVVRA